MVHPGQKNRPRVGIFLGEMPKNPGGSSGGLRTPQLTAMATETIADIQREAEQRAAAKEPRLMRTVYRQLLGHKGFDGLDGKVRGSLLSLSGKLYGKVVVQSTQAANKWARQWWRHLFRGDPAPNVADVPVYSRYLC